MFRGAAILQGIYKRAKQGNASSARAEMVGALAARLAEAAWELVQQQQQQPPARAFSAPPPAPAVVSPTLFDCSNDAFNYVSNSLHISERAKHLRRTALDFIRTKVLPAEPLFIEQINAARPSWLHPPILDELKAQAKVRQAACRCSGLESHSPLGRLWGCGTCSCPRQRPRDSSSRTSSTPRSPSLAE